MDSLRSVRSQVGFAERAVTSGVTPRVAPQPPPARPVPAPQEKPPERPAPENKQTPRHIIPAGSGATRRPSLDELAIRAVEQMRRNGQLDGTSSATRRPSNSSARPAQATQAEPRRGAAEVDRPTQNFPQAAPIGTRPRPPHDRPPHEIEARPTRELRPAEPESPPDPQKALRTLRRAVAGSPDPNVHQALNALQGLVDRVAPEKEPDVARQEQPADEKPRQEPQQQPPQEREQQAPPPDDFRHMLKTAPRYAVQRILGSVAATSGLTAAAPGVSLDMQG